MAVLKRIHVNQFVIRANRRDGRTDPPIRVKTYRDNFACSSAEIRGPSRVVYLPEKPLACGARLWIETYAEVVIAEAAGERAIP